MNNIHSFCKGPNNNLRHGSASFQSGEPMRSYWVSLLIIGEGFLTGVWLLSTGQAIIGESLYPEG